MALATTNTSFLLFLLLAFASTILSEDEAKDYQFSETTLAETTSTEKISHIHFYLHDKLSGENATATPVVQPANPPSPFGMVTIMDDPLTAGPDPKSKLVGRAQGMYAVTAQDEFGLLMAMNLYFATGKYNGSVLTVLGRNPAMRPLREMPIVGGSGLFRFARGFVLVSTHWIDVSSGSAILEYIVTAMHY